MFSLLRDPGPGSYPIPTATAVKSPSQVTGQITLHLLIWFMTAFHLNKPIRSGVPALKSNWQAVPWPRCLMKQTWPQLTLVHSPGILRMRARESGGSDICGLRNQFGN